MGVPWGHMPYVTGPISLSFSEKLYLILLLILLLKLFCLSFIFNPYIFKLNVITDSNFYIIMSMNLVIKL